MYAVDEEDARMLAMRSSNKKRKWRDVATSSIQTVHLRATGTSFMVVLLLFTAAVTPFGGLLDVGVGCYSS